MPVTNNVSVHETKVMNKFYMTAVTAARKSVVWVSGLCLALAIGAVVATEPDSSGLVGESVVDPKPVIASVSTDIQGLSLVDLQNAQVSVWVDNASIDFVVGQLAYLSGRQSIIDGELSGRVSGRFSGSMGATLTALSTTYPVLFDVDDKSLHAVSSDSRSSVSIALDDPELVSKYESEWLDGVLPGNTVEFREDAIWLSGHPAFVKRRARSITSSIATDGLRLPASVVNDAGATAMLRDIQEEAQPTPARAQLTKPIKWVTDIPGFNTF